MKILKLINLPISLISFSLVSIGILVIYSSSVELAVQQIIFMIIGIFFFFIISQLDLESFKNLARPLYYFIGISLVVVLIFGIETRGVIRWFPIGMLNIQPSEFAKPLLVLFFSKYWSENYPSWRNIFKSLLWFLPVFLLVFKQPDLGSALTLVVIWLGILFASHISIRKILILILVAVLIIPTSWSFLYGYQKERIVSFLAPESDPLGTGYNLIQSTIAVGSGQFLGRGLGRGTQSRLQFLPEFRTDFIFASIAEEMGFLGSILILSLYLSLLSYCLILTRKINDSFNLLVTFGVVSMLMFQIVVNIGMNIGLLPITGITLPLISYGGSSLVSVFLSLGFIAAAVRHRATVA